MELTREIFEKFTGQSRRAIALAHHEARHWKHDCITTEHLMIGLLRDEASFATSVLREQSLRTDELIEAFDRELASTEPTTLPTLAITPRAVRTLYGAIDLALEMNQPRASSSHILLAMLRDADSSVCRHLEELGFDRFQAEVSIRSAPPEPDRDAKVHLPRPEAGIRAVDPTPKELADLFLSTVHIAADHSAHPISPRESMTRFGIALRDAAKLLNGRSASNADDIRLPEQSFRLTSNFSPAATLGILFGGILLMGAMVSAVAVWRLR